eukprot:SAG25_NODE_3472_length_1069_cov_1.315464_3_plen_27_part_01
MAVTTAATSQILFSHHPPDPPCSSASR